MLSEADWLAGAAVALAVLVVIVHVMGGPAGAMKAHRRTVSRMKRGRRDA